MINISINSFIYFSKFSVYCETEFQNIYETNSYFKKSVDVIVYSTNYFFDFMSYKRKEPKEKTWINIICLLEDLKYIESYKILDESINNSNFQEEVVKAKDLTLESNCFNQKIKDIVIISKFQNNYLIWNEQMSKHIPEKINNNPDECKIYKKILSVSYNHPLMDESIDITRNVKKLLNINSVAFTPAFILHCLEYQDNMYVFDKKYKIHIIDNEVNEYIIHFNECLLIFDEKIEIKNIE